MAKGGARPGAGRKPGKGDNPHIKDYWSEADIAIFFEHMKERYKNSDRIAVWIGDQISGKAVQMIVGDKDKPIAVEIVKYASD